MAKAYTHTITREDNQGLVIECDDGTKVHILCCHVMGGTRLDIMANNKVDIDLDEAFVKRHAMAQGTPHKALGTFPFTRLRKMHEATHEGTQGHVEDNEEG